MKAIVTKEFAGVKDGEIYPRTWKAGDEIEGDLARVAIAEGWAESATKAAPKSEPEEADKPRKKPGKK